jgi:hypothetical protein
MDAGQGWSDECDDAEKDSAKSPMYGILTNFGNPTPKSRKAFLGARQFQV